MTAVAKAPPPPPPASGRRAPAGTGPVAQAARATLRDIETEHAAAPLLIAMGQRLADDVDNTDKVSDRIAAIRTILELVRLLDGALMGPVLPSGPNIEGKQDADGEEKADDPFNIGHVPPSVGDETP